jgi:FlaA1/EpsC-like NDP-sugar epimerase
MVQAAAEFGANIFVMISTDKAVNPTSIMGASKRVAEMVVRDQAVQGGKTRFCCVRFGNVLGSRASVIPLFQKRISEGKNIKVTHPEIKRYFMTIPEASQLVIQAGSLATDGETFVLDMGDPVRIVDLARDLIEQSGLVIGEDIEIQFTGLRPGEKLFEELLVDENKGFRSTKYSKIFVEQRLPYNSSKLRSSIEQLVEAAKNSNADAICDVFLELGIGFQRKILPIEKKIRTGQKE